MVHGGDGADLVLGVEIGPFEQHQEVRWRRRQAEFGGDDDAGRVGMARLLDPRPSFLRRGTDLLVCLRFKQGVRGPDLATKGQPNG